MKILTNADVKKLFDNIMSLYLVGSDSVKAMALQPGNFTRGLQLQRKLSESMMESVFMLRGLYGMKVSKEYIRTLKDRRASGEIPECWPETENNVMQKAYIWDVRKDRILHKIWINDAPAVGEIICASECDEIKHYKLEKRIYGINDEHHSGCWNLYVSLIDENKEEDCKDK